MTSQITESAVLSRFCAQIEIKKVIVPKLQPRQLLVKIHFAAICGSQIFEWRGQRANEKWLPHMFGHEAFGEIVDLNDCSQIFRIGEKVVVSWLSNGLESGETPLYQDLDGNRINAGKCAVFSRLVVVSQDRVFKVPQSINPMIAPLFGCAIPTGAGMVLKFSKRELNTPVLVRGFGGVGMAASAALRALGISNVYVDDVSLERTKKATLMGFQPLDNSKHMRFQEIFDATGSASSIENSFSILSETGILVFASHPPEGEKITLDPFDLIKGKNICGTWGGGISSQASFDEVVRLLQEAVHPKDFVGDCFKLEEINQAMHYAVSAKVGRALLLCD